MASTTQPSMFLTLLTIYLMSTCAESAAGRGAIAVHWGNLGGDINEGTLKEACATGNYNIVIINSLLVHDDGTTPELELPGHCGNTSYPLHQARVTSSILPKPKYPSLTFHLEVLKNILILIIIIIITISLLILP